MADGSQRTDTARSGKPAGVVAFRIAVALCALLGLTLRLWNLDFDQRQHQHPDERFWAMTADAMAQAEPPAPHGTFAGPLLDWLDGERTSSSPYRATESFLYGPISLALARTTAGWLHDGAVDGSQPAKAVVHAFDAVGVPLLDDAGNPRFDDRYGVDLPGRLLGALLDTLTIVAIAAIARRVAGRVAGVAAAALYALCVIAIQYAHFLGSEPLLGLVCACTVLATLRVDRSHDVRAAAAGGALVGLCAGAAVAVKLSAVGLAVVPAVGAIYLLVRMRRRSDLVRLASMGIATAATFRVLEPSAFSGLGLRLSPAFRADLDRAAGLPTDTWPPAFQWVGRVPVLQPLGWLFGYSIGPAIFVGATVAVAAIVAAAWPSFGSWLHARTPTRWKLAAAARRCSILLPRTDRWTAIVLVASVVVPFAFISLTAWPTSRYFFPMLPALTALGGIGLAATVNAVRLSAGGARLAWSGLVVAMAATALLWGVGFVHGVYGQTHPRIEASRWIAANVAAGSVLSSQAWDDVLPLGLPGIDQRAYPIEQFDMVSPDDTAKVLRIAEQLQRIDYVVESSDRIWGSVTTMPARFPSTLRFFEALDSGELGFQRVATFRNRPGWDLWSLDSSRTEEAFSVYDHPEVRIWQKVRALDKTRIAGVLRADAAARAIPVDPNKGVANGLQLTPAELAANAVGPTYDEAFSTNGSPLLHLIGWFLLLELLGFAAFALFLPLFVRLPDAGLGVSKILGLGVLAAALFLTVSWTPLRLDRWLVVALATAFLVAGLASARRRRTQLHALWVQRRGVLVTVEIIGIVCLLFALSIRWRNPDLWHPARSGEKPFELAYLTAVLRSRTIPVYDPWFSGGALNYYYGGFLLLAAPARLLRTAPGLVLNIGVAVFVWCSSGAAFTLGAALVSGARERWRARSWSMRGAVVGGSLATFFLLAVPNLAVVPAAARTATDGANSPIDWWALSRVIPGSVAITEFPAWSVLFSDLHPHVMGIAVLVGFGVICLALLDALLDCRSAHGFVLAGMAGAGVALVRMTNTWDFPLAAGVLGVVMVAALMQRVPLRRLLAPAAIALVVAFVAFGPYTARGEVFDSGFEAATLRTNPGAWFVQFGLFAAVTAAVIAATIGMALDRSRPVVWRITRAQVGVMAATVVALAYLAARPAFSVFALTVALALGSAWVGWRRMRRHGPSLQRAVPMAVLAAGWAVQAGVEYLTVLNDGGRMNTVFKFWFQSWILLALGCGAVAAESVVAVASRRRKLARTPRTPAVLAALAIPLAATFWWTTMPVRLSDRISDSSRFLDGEAFLRPEFSVGEGVERYVPLDDLALITWLRAQVPGLPTVAEAPGIDYRWSGRISWSTGLPTPIGWAYHQTQQRRPYGPFIDRRVEDLGTLYRTTDQQEIARVLATYDVAYVVFGTQERLLADEASTAALRSFPCMTVLVQADRTTEAGTVPGELFVAAVDRACVSSFRRW
jgi:YYY domain-containing protein